MRPRRPHRQHSTGWWARSSVISSPDNHVELSVMRGSRDDSSEEVTFATGTPHASYATAMPVARAVHSGMDQRGNERAAGQTAGGT
jgi:hypothetical protein